MTLSKSNVRWALGFIILFRVLLMMNLDAHTYWTFDEPWNTETAKQVIDEGKFRRTKDSFTPIAIANVFVGQQINKIWSRLDRLTADRVTGIVLNQASVPLSYAFALELGATSAVALFFAALLGFEPNLLGHSILASGVDGYIFTWFLLLALVAFRWYRALAGQTSSMEWRRLALFGFVLGLAQGVKLTAAYALPLCVIWMAYAFWKAKNPNLKGRHVAARYGVFIFMSWLGLCVFYAFNKIGMPLGKIPFTSQPFQKLAAHMPWFPAVIPVDYLQGLDMCLKTDTSPRPVYIRNTFLLHGVWYYFIYAMCLKTPLPLLISNACGWIVAAKKKFFNFSAPVVFVGLFGVAMMIYFSFFFNAQIGIRYLFPIYAFLLAGILWFPWKKTTVAICVVWMAATMLYNWPNEIGYFNEVVPLKQNRWWHLGDSNLTWNQEWKDWPAFIAEKHLSNDQVAPPTLPIGISFYEPAITVSGILSNRPQLEILRDHFSPMGSFWGVDLEYFITGREALNAFPPQGSGPAPLAARACPREGWLADGSVEISANDTLPHQLSPGRHVLTSFFDVKTQSAVPVFFQVASKNDSDLSINNRAVLAVTEPTPRLRAATLNLEPGVYETSIVYNKIWNDGFISVRAYVLANGGADVTQIHFCLPASDAKP